MADLDARERIQAAEIGREWADMAAEAPPGPIRWLCRQMAKLCRWCAEDDDADDGFY